jgi:phosphinothricin acetyltransferase
MSEPAVIRAATIDDATAIAAIYNHYITDTTVTFEETPIDAVEMAARMHDVTDAGLPWLVTEFDNTILGYAYATKWRTRIGYRFSVESSIYLAPSAVGRRLGTPLYQALLAALRERPIHSVIGGIALPNDASIALHERLGFAEVAHFREVGQKFGQWIDVGYWQVVWP